MPHCSEARIRTQGIDASRAFTMMAVPAPDDAAAPTKSPAFHLEDCAD